MTATPLGTRFEIGLTLRIAVLLAAGAALAWAITRPGLYATTLLAGIVTGAALAELWLFVRRTNFAVARFVEALAHDDFSQGFGGAGGGFGALAESLNGAIGRLRAERAAIQDENRYLAALLDDVPSPLVSIDGDNRVALLNKAARRLLTMVTRLPDLAAHGESFLADIAAMRPGERRATQLLVA
ncbi:MAG: sensor histidine kinase, partial [Sandarakinorhabdus sp.]|nr:sensor histidine kinase [Sandarakinorhabdus sp.]